MGNRKPPPPLNPPRSPSIAALAREAGEAADIALGSARIAKKAAESIPKPDVRDDVNFQRLSGARARVPGAHLAASEPVARAACGRRAHRGVRPAPGGATGDARRSARVPRERGVPSLR